MKLLVLHNRYRYRGGEDVCVENELHVFQEAGVQLRAYLPKTGSTLSAIGSAIGSTMGLFHEGHIERIIDAFRPDILHVHNLFPLFSPRIFQIARNKGVRTVMTLHNYRPLCLNGLFMTPQKKVCEQCAPNHYGPGIKLGCYRESCAASALLAAHLTLARRRGWYDAVDLFISPSEFLREKFISYGWPSDRLTVQTHVLPDPVEETPSPSEGYVLYLGRLSEEKGVSWLVDTFARRTEASIILRVAGTGPLETALRRSASKRIQFLGHVDGEQKRSLLRGAAALVMPSTCYENVPLAILEAQSEGVPILVPDQGGLRELAEPGTTGLRYRPNDRDDFWKQLEVLAFNPDSFAARQKIQRYTAARYGRAEFLNRRLALYSNVIN